MPPSLLQLIHSLPLDLVAWYRNRNRHRSPSEERTVALVVILAVPITALPIAIASAAVIAIAATTVIAIATATVIAILATVVIPTGAMIGSVTTVVSSTRLGRNNSDYC
jgi:putative Mn2+ efflux pump MntP